MPTTPSAKAGMTHGLLLSLKNEIVRVAPNGRVNLVAPGWTVTPMTEKDLTQETVDRVTATMPLRKVATAEDVARAIVFLLLAARGRPRDRPGHHRGRRDGGPAAALAATSLGSGNQRARSKSAVTGGASTGPRAARRLEEPTPGCARAARRAPPPARARSSTQRDAVAVPPDPGAGIEPVVREQLPAVLGDEVHGVDDVAERLLADEVVEAEARERELGAQVPAQHLGVHQRRTSRRRSDTCGGCTARRRSSRCAPGCRTGR